MTLLETSEKICANHIDQCAVIFCVHFRKTTTDMLHITQDIYDTKCLINTVVFSSLSLSLSLSHTHTQNPCIKAGNPQYGSTKQMVLQLSETMLSYT